MSLMTEDSLSKGFENPLESHLHGVDGLRREHSPLSAHSLPDRAASPPRFLGNEKTALPGCFFEEFSYENVNLYKRKIG